MAPCTITARTLVLVPAGQSNAANHGDVRYTAKSPYVINYDIDRDACFHARDPLLGATSEAAPKGGSIWSRLGELLIQTGRWDQVFIAPVAVGGSYMKDWGAKGQYFPRLVKVLSQLRARGFRKPVMLWIEGEADAAGTVDGSVDVAGFKKDFGSMTRGLKDRGLGLPVYVAVATTCYGSANAPFAFGADLEKLSPDVRAAVLRRQRTLQEAQFSLADENASARRGPNLDLINAHSRWDGCHLNGYGQQVAAELWLDMLLRSPIGQGSSNRRRPNNTQPN